MDQRTAITIHPLTLADQHGLDSFTIEHWRAREVVVHTTVSLPAMLPGFAAEAS